MVLDITVVSNFGFVVECVVPSVGSVVYVKKINVNVIVIDIFNLTGGVVLNEVVYFGVVMMVSPEVVEIVVVPSLEVIVVLLSVVMIVVVPPLVLMVVVSSVVDIVVVFCVLTVVAVGVLSVVGT